MTITITNRSFTLLLASTLLSIALQAQNLGVNATGATPNTSSILDLNTGNTFTSPNGKGLLPPNVALTSITDAVTITSPATSLWVYNTAAAGTGTAAVAPGYYYWDGTKWVRLQTATSTAPDWSLLGNTGTIAGTNFLGTTDAQDVVIKTNNLEKMRITTTGSVGIGIATPSANVHVSVPSGFAGTVNPFRSALWVDVSTQSSNGYSIFKGTGGTTFAAGIVYGLNLDLNPSGISAGNQYGVYVNNETQNYFSNKVGIGIATPGAKLHVTDNQNRRTLHVEHNFNGLVNTDAAFIGGIDASYSSTGLFVLQKDNVSLGSTGTNLINVVSNSVSQMVINGLGNVGIGTTAPTTKLSIVATATNTGFQLQDGSEGVGKTLISDVSGKATWSDPTSNTYDLNSSIFGPIATTASTLGNTITLAKGVYYVQPYNLITSVVYSNQYYANISVVASFGTVISNAINRDFTFFGTVNGYYTMPGFIVKITSPTANVALKLMHGNGGTFSIPSTVDGLIGSFTKIN